MAVAWDRGSEPIYRSEHLLGGDAGSHRLYLDVGHHLVFNPATVQDSGRNSPSAYTRGHLTPLLHSPLVLLMLQEPLTVMKLAQLSHGDKVLGLVLVLGPSLKVCSLHVPDRRCSSLGAYTCWLQGRPAAQVYLLVYAHLGQGRPVTSHRDFPSALQSTLKSYAVMTAIFSFLVLSRAVVRFLRDTREEHLD